MNVQTKADYLFEVSWEVCNKVGGIYTVIKSKSSEMMDLYKNYFLIGPYFEHNVKVNFVSMDPPEEFRNTFEELKGEGIICHYGKWLETKGKPYAILLETNGLLSKKNEIKGKLWEYYGIDSMRAQWDFEEPMVWSYAAGMLIDRLQNSSLSGKRIVAQFHEWLSGFGILYLKKYCPQVATVFTTHATVLGRTLSSKGVNIYAPDIRIDIGREIYYNIIEAKHAAESQSAKNADVFTTVSEITGIEAERFLGRKPDVILINGLDLEKFPSFEDISIKHITSRDKIREFITYYFFPYYTFEVNDNLIAYTAGRFEYSNKGYDLVIRALGRLNSMLKQEGNAKTMTMIFWVPMQHYGIRLDVLENKNYYMHIKNYINSNSPEILQRMTYEFISKKENVGELLTESFISDIKKDLVAFSREGEPPLSTHYMDAQNSILSALTQYGLNNRKEDAVKVIVEPVYLDGTDGFIDLTYYDAMVGCHLGLFPSSYEPWGYTPLESAALGVPSVTTDMSGFGKFIKSQNPDNKGIIVLDRLNREDNEVVEDFCNILYRFLEMSHSERINCKLKAKALSGHADWSILAGNYVNAHNMALDRK